MNINKIKVPTNVTYLSDWDGFEFPNGILNKMVCGCGATELALTDNIPTIVASPRNQLILNKAEQHKEVLVVNANVKEEEIKDYVKNKPIPKILTTYDSLYKIVNSVDIKNFRLIVDEFHCIFLDSAFKSEKELGFLRVFNMFTNVTYLTATPIAMEYIYKLPFFANIPYYQLEWDEKAIKKPQISLIQSNNPIMAAYKMIDSYKKGDYLAYNGVICNELVFYLNSVKTICKLIKKAKLRASDVNIICASKIENEEMISTLGKGYGIGKIPMKGEYHKMFTFCTSTAYFGCDFYSDCAVSVVVNDCHTKTTITDISTELPQICGRERNNNNIFKDYTIFIYNKNYSTITDEEFKLIQNEKNEKTQKEIENYNIMPCELKRDIIKLLKINNYKESYTFYDVESGQFKKNEMAALVEEYNFKIKAADYLNSIRVKKAINNNGMEVHNDMYLKVDGKIKDMVNNQSFADRMKKICDDRVNTNFSIHHDGEMVEYVNLLGVDKIKSLNYQQSKIKKEILKKQQILSMTKPFNFEVGDVIPCKEMKEKIQNLYKENNISSTATATDIKKWYPNAQITRKSIKGITTAVVVF